MMMQSPGVLVNLAVGSFDQYLDVVNQQPKLSAEQEVELANRYRQEADLEAAGLLIMSNLRYVIHIARSYNGYGLALPDLVQEGNIGLMKAVKRYDPGVGVRLISFAVHWIKAEIHEFVIRNWRIVKIATTKSQRKLFFNLRKSKSGFGWLTREEAQAMATDLGVKVDQVYEMEARLDGYDLALDAPVEGAGEISYAAPAEYLRQEGADPAELVETDEWNRREHTLLAQAIDDLDDRSRDIVSSRWLCEDKSTLQDLADRYQVSPERIRQLESNALKKLRKKMAAVL